MTMTTLMTGITELAIKRKDIVHEDSARLTEVTSVEQREITARAVTKPFGKVFYALPRLQAMQWVSDPMPAKMLTLYLSIANSFVEAGAPRGLMNRLARAFGNIKGKPLVPRLYDSVMFTAVPWHMRALRAFKLLVEEFENGHTVESYGSASGIIELMALATAGNPLARLTLVDNDIVGTGLAWKVLALLRQSGYDVSDQVVITQGDLHKCRPSPMADTVVSLGLLHNYFCLDEANVMMRRWFATSNIRRVITDIYYDPKEVDDVDRRVDAILRTRFVKDVLNWKIGDEPGGLRFCGKEDFCSSLPEFSVSVYNHGVNATMVVTR